nr:STAS domain-containing protein [Pseudonocardia acidicola]
MLERPTDAALEIRLHSPAPAVVVVRPAGELDLVSAPLLVERVQFQLRFHEHVVVDLRDITFLASSGLRGLLDVRKAACAAGVTLYLTSADTPGVARVLALTGLAEVLPIVAASTEELVASLVYAERLRKR